MLNLDNNYWLDVDVAMKWNIANGLEWLRNIKRIIDIAYNIIYNLTKRS